MLYVIRGLEVLYSVVDEDMLIKEFLWDSSDENPINAAFQNFVFKYWWFQIK